MTLTLHKSQIHSESGSTECWTCNSLMSAPLPAEEGCETCERFVRSLVFIV